MPTAPRCLTLKPFWMRPMPWPRWQTTILPVKAPSGVALAQNGSLAGAAAALTTDVGVLMPAVSDTPTSDRVAASLAVRLIVFLKERLAVLAATVVTHGPRWATVSASGPELPAEAATNTPAL